MQTEALRSPSQGAAAPMHSMLDSSNVVLVLSVSRAGRVVGANSALARALGRDSTRAMIGSKLSTDLLKDSADWKHWQSADTDGLAENVELLLQGADGREVALRGDIKRDVDAGVGEPVLVGVFVDISNVKILESALQRSARMEALSALVTGAVHDFNNVLTVLIGNLYLVAEGVRENPPLFGKVKAARDVARRGAELIKQLLSFARTGTVENGRVNVVSLISKIEPLLARAVGSGIKLKTELNEDTALAEGNSAMIESAVVNLVVNARDALERRGNIGIRVVNASMSAADAERRGIAPGHYVRISVLDDGPGISQELQKQVFEPFFSTKRESGGTGLGLSMVRRMAEQSHGAVELASKLGKGTSISILLPRSESTTAETTIKTMPLSTLPTGDEKVLLIANDKEILTTTQQILNVLGYEVRATSKASDAPAQLATSPVDLVIVDSTTAAGSAASNLGEAIGKIVPKARLLFIEDSTGARKAGSGRHILIKPFSLLDLASAVRKTLDGGANE